MNAKSKTLIGLLDVLAIIIFNVCFFLLTSQPNILPDGRTTATWINYGCVHGALILFMITPLIYPRNVGKDVSMPIYSATFRFWWFELLLSAILVFLITIPVVYNILIQVVCWGVILAKLIVLALVNLDTSEKQQRHERELLYVKTAECLLKTKLNDVADKEEYRHLEKVYDYIRTSPVKSNSEAQSIELQILQMINLLTTKSDNTNTLALCNDIMHLAQQRNQVLAINNKSL